METCIAVYAANGRILQFQLINEDGSYNRQGIMFLANANWSFRKAKGWNLKADRELAFRDAWHKARAMKTRFLVAKAA